MAVQKQFECEDCGAFGKIILRGDQFTFEEIVYCPLCSSDIYEEETYIDDENLDDLAT